MEDEVYGIDIDNAHPRAVKLVPDEFFWDCSCELAPFGSDEGDTALGEFRDWRKDNPTAPVSECIIWTIESVGEIEIDEYNESILSEKKIKQQIDDKTFDDQQYIYTLDVSVIATAFAQLVDEGKIDSDAKPYARLALNRQILWAKLQRDWPHSDMYIEILNRLHEILDQA